MGTAAWISIAVVVVLVVLLALYLWVARSSLVALRARVDEAWSDITAQVRRRHALLPALIEAVAAYTAHDRKVLDALTSAGAETVAAAGPAEASLAEAHLQQALRSLFTVADTYPPLQASTDFLRLRSELVDTEEQIQAGRRFYNGGVRELNTKVRVFPGTLFARREGLGQREFFETGTHGATAEPPRIQF